MTTEAKIKALVSFLKVYSPDEIKAEDRYAHSDIAPDTFSVGNQEYLVLTDGEATQAAREHIRESLWAFTPRFILDHSEAGKITVASTFDRLEKALRKMQETLCEDANEIVFALIEDFETFVEEAIKADGRGHFLSSYDGNEGEARVGKQTFYIYRVN